MTKPEAEGPKKFDVVLRGYARGPVDEYVARLHEWLVDSEARADHAVKAAAAAVGERVNDILRTALEAGEEARRSAEAQAAKVLHDAEERAGEAMRFAERRAEQVRERAEESAREAEKASADALAQAEKTKAEALAHAEEVKAGALAQVEKTKADAVARAKAETERHRQEARSEIEALNATIRQLDEKKQHILDELGRLQAFLAGAPNGATQAADAEVTASPAGPAGARADHTDETEKAVGRQKQTAAQRGGGITAAPDNLESAAHRSSGGR